MFKWVIFRPTYLIYYLMFFFQEDQWNLDGVAVSEVYQPMFNCGKDIVSIKFAMTRHSDPRLIIRKYHNLTVSCSHLISAFSLFGNT